MPGYTALGMPYPSALRQVPNLVACKNLYMDLDVKEGAYKTTERCARSIQGFLARSQAANGNYHRCERHGRLPYVLDAQH